MMSVIDCIYVGPTVNQQLDHFKVAPFRVSICSTVQWRHARLILQVYVSAFIKKLFNCRKVSSRHIAQELRFFLAQIDRIHMSTAPKK